MPQSIKWRSDIRLPEFTSELLRNKEINAKEPGDKNPFKKKEKTIFIISTRFTISSSQNITP
jgi:hypothetical protein